MASNLQWIWSEQHQDYYYTTRDSYGQYQYHWYKAQRPRVDSGTYAEASPYASFGGQDASSSHASASAGGLSQQQQQYQQQQYSPQQYLQQQYQQQQYQQQQQASEGPEMPEPVDYYTRASLPNLIPGTPQDGWYERLDSSYRMRTGAEAREFFKKGRVFSMLYSEAASEMMARGGGGSDNGITVIRFGEHVYSQIRRFVVVAVKQGFVYACGITTYSRRGTLKGGCIPSEHTIVYLPGTQPHYLNGEYEAGMTKTPIQIIPADSSLTLDPTSRLRFSKMYPIEWNVKVKDIGRVHPEHLSPLIAYWQECAQSVD